MVVSRNSGVPTSFTGPSMKAAPITGLGPSSYHGFRRHSSHGNCDASSRPRASDSFQSGFCTSSPRKDGNQKTLPFLPQQHRPAGRPAFCMGAASSSAPHRAIVRFNSSSFSSGHKENNPPALGIHKCAEEQRGSPQPNTTGREMQTIMGPVPSVWVCGAAL